MGTHLDAELPGQVIERRSRPDGTDPLDGVHVEQVGGPHRDDARLHVDVDHVAGRSVVGGSAEVQPAALPDGEGVRAVVSGHDGSGARVHDVAGLLAQRPAQEARCVAVGDEADVVAVGLAGDQEAAARGLGAHVLLQVRTQRQQGAPQLIRGQHSQHVRLVLRRVDRPVQLRASGAVDDARVVSRGDRVEVHGHGPVEDGAELDALVASHARIRRAALAVLLQEVLDHLVREALGQVPDVEGDAEHVGHPTRIASIVEGAASLAARSAGERLARQGEVDADDLMTCVDHPGCGHGRVDAPGHRGDDAHLSPPAGRAIRHAAPGPRPRAAPR